MAVFPAVNNLRAAIQKVIFVPIVYGFFSLLPLFLSGWESSDRVVDKLLSTVRSKENMFDFVVVGGGTAGALVANRLAEHYKVLLLEAGGTPMPFQSIPALALKVLNHHSVDWSYKTVPQRNACLNSINQQASWSAGRGLGGSSNINFMTHNRGHPKDFNNWAEITGDPSWSYSGILSYFKRTETFSGTSNDPEARGHDGELRVRRSSYLGLSEDWIRAGQELGYPFVDLNGDHEEGFGFMQQPIYKGIRQSTYTAFLLPVHKSPRLTIRRYALVRKILFRDMNNMAYGVEYVRHGRVETAIATKEVILSAGTLGSSKLLMLSGVGPRGHLDELGIPVRSDLPVGANLQDHLVVPLGPFFIREPKSFLFDRDVTPENIVRWLFLGTGPITTTGYIGAASVSSSFAKARGEGNWPDIHLVLHGQAIHQGYADAFAYAYSLQEDQLALYYKNAIGHDSFHIYVTASRPTSTGQVLLGGSGIGDPLVINPRYLNDNAHDFKILLEGVKTAFRITNTSMFQRLGTEFTTAKLPGCHELELGSDAYAECYIRRFTLSMFNPVGTVALGSCVDSYLRVRGTRSLRVVDASIQPTLVSSGTSASTLMIAEKAVDMILKDHGIPDRDHDLYDVVFGRSGFFKNNPLLRVLQRELDTINPVRALFKPFVGNKHESSDGNERVDKHGRGSKSFLQVISEVFGTSHSFHADTSASGTVSLNKVNFDQENKINKSALAHKLGEIHLQEVNRVKNVVGENDWLFHSKENDGGSSQSSRESSETIKVKEKRSKGGRRYALLQAILREMELNASRLHNFNNNYPPITLLGRPVVEVVKFEKQNLAGDQAQDTSGKTGSSFFSFPYNFGTLAKPVQLGPNATVPVHSSGFSDVGSELPGVLGSLLNSIGSLEALVHSFFAKDRLPPPATSSLSTLHPAKEHIPLAISQEQNELYPVNSSLSSFFGIPLPSGSNNTQRQKNEDKSSPSLSALNNTIQFPSLASLFNGSLSSWFQSSTSNTSSWPISAANIEAWNKPLFNESYKPWFQPLGVQSPSPSSWFAPKPDATGTPSDALSKATSPRSDPLSDLAQLIFGGLQKRERKDVSVSLNSLSDTGKMLQKLFSISPKKNDSSEFRTNKTNTTILKKLSKSNKSSKGDILENLRTQNTSIKNSELVQSVVSLVNFMNSFIPTKTIRPKPSNITGPADPPQPNKAQTLSAPAATYKL